MAISTYTELIDAIVSWSHADGDTEFEAMVPSFIKVFEARCNRDLRVTDMEETLASTPLVDGAASLPDGFLAFKELRFAGDSEYTLQPKSLEWIRAKGNLSTGDAKYFAVTKDSVVCFPPTGPVKGTFYEEIPGLQDNETNWLLTSHPDAYLFGVLTEAALWTRDENLSVWAERAKATLDVIQRKDDQNQFDGGPIAMRAR